jgi:hypothetical protein
MGIARPGMVGRSRPAHLLYIFLDDYQKYAGFF